METRVGLIIVGALLQIVELNLSRWDVAVFYTYLTIFLLILDFLVVEHGSNIYTRRISERLITIQAVLVNRNITIDSQLKDIGKQVDLTIHWLYRIIQSAIGILAQINLTIDIATPYHILWHVNSRGEHETGTHRHALMQCKDLFRTITMNSVSVALSENRTTNKPIWRWESNTSLFFRPKEVSLDHLSGLFCPSKVIAAKKVENNIVKSVVQSPLRFGKNDDNILEDLRQKWAISFEPHCVVNYQNLPMKKDKKTKKDVRDFQKNPYRSFPRGSNHLWILTGATQTKTAKLSETEFIQLAMAAKNTRRCFEDGKKVIFTDEDVHVRNYYRSCDSHWVYETTGTQDGILPFALFMSTDKQLFVRKAIEYISNAGFKLDVCVKNYYNYDKSDLRPSASFSYTMYNYLGINGEQNGLFRQIADANKKSDLDTLWSKLTKHIVTTAMEVFTQYLIPAKTADYYKQRTDLRKELYGNKGAKLYVTDNKQESKS